VLSENQRDKKIQSGKPEPHDFIGRVGGSFFTQSAGKEN